MLNTAQDQKNVTASRFRTIITLAGAIVFLIGGIVLVGRITGYTIIASIYPNYIPMATATAIMSTGYGLILLSGAYRSGSRLMKAVVTIFIPLFTVYALLKFMEYFLQTDLTLDTLVFPVTETLAQFPTNRLSPVTGLLFFLSGIAMMIRIYMKMNLRTLNIVAGLGAFIAFSGFTGLIGYLLGTPLLYGGDIIPLSFLTTVVFLLIGGGILAMSGPETIFLRRFSGSSASAKLLRVIVPLIVVALLADDLLEKALSDVYLINPAVIPAVMLLVLIALAVFVVLKRSARVFREADALEKERTMMEEELNDQVTFLHTVIDSLPHPFYVINPENYTVMLGNTASGWNSITNTCHALTHGFDQPCVDDPKHPCPVCIIRKTMNPVVLEHIHVDNAGNERNVEVHAYPIFSREGKLTQVIEYSLDITDRKRKEESLRESEERFRTLTETSTDAIVSIDAEGRILFFNESAERIFGYSADEIHLQTIDLLIPERFGRLFLTGISRYIETGISTILGKIFEFRGRRKDGEHFPLELSLSEIIVGGKVNFIGIVRDISDRKRIEEKLKQSTQELRESNQTKDKFFSNIAHDLKSPFNAILGLTNVLIHDYRQLNETQVEDLLNTIKASSQRAFELLENLLSWANSQTGVIEYKPGPVNLHDLVNETIVFLTIPAAAKGISIRSTLTENCKSYGDHHMILTVLRNLVLNAVKFTPYGGEVIVSAEHGREACYVSVKDTGVGIAKSDMEKIFRIDSKHSTRGTADEKGTGLGLILCREFIEKHKGTIWVESEEGKGSTFRFSLPFH